MSKYNGLRAYIRSKLPESWEHVLRQEKKIGEFVELMYNSQPKGYRGKYGWYRGKRNVQLCFNHGEIHRSIDMRSTKQSYSYWYSIHERIKIYEELCR